MVKTLTYPNISYDDNNYTVIATIKIGKKDKKGRSYIDLQPIENYYCLSITYNVIQNGETIRSCQCQDFIDEIAPNHKELQRIRKLQDAYHCNDLHAGTQEQENYLALFPEVKDYKERLALLDKEGLNNPYKYGSDWLVKIIPTYIIDEIKDLHTSCLKDEEKIPYADIIQDYLTTTMLEEELLDLWNGWFNDYDFNNVIHYNDESFFEQYYGGFKEAIIATQTSNYDANDRYVAFNGAGRLVSFDSILVDASPYSNEQMADIIYDNQELFGQLLDAVKEDLVTI